MATDNSNPITQGSLKKALFALAGPMFASALLQNAQSLIDLFWVGRLGAEAVAALALSGTILFLMWPIVMGMSIGTVALVARHIGGGRPDQAASVAGQSLGLSILAGALVGAGGLLGLNALLRVIGAEAGVAGLARSYLSISFVGFFTVFLLAIGTSAMQGAGNALLPMGAMILANLLNLCLDPLLIFGGFGVPAMGVAGAAWATVFSQAVAGLLLAGFLFRGIPNLKVGWRHLAPRLRIAWELFRIGIFSAGQMLARSLMVFALFRIVATCGTAALAGYGIGMRFHQMILLPCFVLGNASAALVGQNLGAGRPDRAVDSGWLAARIGMLINLAAAAVLFFFAAHLTGLFTDDPAVVAVGAEYLRLVSPFYVFAALGIILGRSMNGAGDTVPTMIITIATLWGVQVPLAHALAAFFTPATTGVWWSIALSNTLHGLVTAAWFRLGRWKLKKIG
ncbi:MAG: MATE family efflux transporter [Kiritimatiellia bacterium]